MSYTLHAVTKENAKWTIPAVLSLVRALAVYEKCVLPPHPFSHQSSSITCSLPIYTALRSPDSVHATEEILTESFFGDKEGRKYCEGVLAYINGSPEEGGKAVGMAVYCFSFSTWTGRGGLYLEDLFVDESQRGKGIAKALFKYLGNVAKDRNLPRMDWVVLDWNKDAKEVYKRMGAVHMKEWEGMRLTGEALARLAE